MKMLAPRRVQRACRVLIPVAGIAALIFGAGTASASEGGASFYLLGSGGPSNAQLPPLPGLFFDTTTYIYDGSASASADRQFVVVGNLVANLDATIAANFMTALWVPSTDILGGTLAIGDSGGGREARAVQGRVTGIGATAPYNFRIGRTPTTLRFRIFQEFGAVSRLEGTSAFLSLSFPISMRMPMAQPQS